MVHTGLRLVSMSVDTDASVEARPGEIQIIVPVLSDQPSSAREGQTQHHCTGFPPCSKSFEDESNLLSHVRYAISRSSGVRVALISNRSHKGWVTRRAKRRGLSTNNKKTRRIRGANTSGTPSQKATRLLPKDRLTSAPTHGGNIEERIIDGHMGSDLTGTCARNERVELARTTSAEGVCTPESSTAKEASGEIASPLGACRSQLGLGILPTIEQQLRRSVMKELEASLVQAQPDSRDISKHMQMITKSTSNAVTKILSPYRYTSFVEYRATGLEDVTELSAIVFGDTREEEILKIALGIRSHTKMQTETLLRAYTSAAVTQWVLRVDFRDRYGARGTVCNGPDIRRQSMENFIKRGWYVRPDDVCGR
jgi:hypothetical protein